MLLVGLTTAFNPITMAKTRIKKYIFDVSNEPQYDDLYIIGVKTNMPLHKLAYYLNNSFDLKLSVHPKKITEKRKKKQLEFDFFATPADNLQEPLYLVNNETLYEIDDPNGGMFSSSEAFYLIPELENINYLFFVSKNDLLDIATLQQQFAASHPVKWVAVDMKKISTAIPIFPNE